MAIPVKNIKEEKISWFYMGSADEVSRGSIGKLNAHEGHLLYQCFVCFRLFCGSSNQQKFLQYAGFPTVTKGLSIIQ
jgi:hypothetical protein